MSYQWSLSPEAEEAIFRQMQWYLLEVGDGGAELASRWSKGLETTLEKFAENPHRYGFAPENGDWLPDLQIRQMLFRPWKSGIGWRVLYVMNEREKLVTVVQVRHEHRRWMHDSDDGTEC